MKSDGLGDFETMAEGDEVEIELVPQEVEEFKKDNDDTNLQVSTV